MGRRCFPELSAVRRSPGETSRRGSYRRHLRPGFDASYACHGLANSSKPPNSALLMAYQEERGEGDWNVYLSGDMSKSCLCGWQEIPIGQICQKLTIDDPRLLIRQRIVPGHCSDVPLARQHILTCQGSEAPLQRVRHHVVLAQRRQTPFATRLQQISGARQCTQAALRVFLPRIGV